MRLGEKDICECNVYCPRPQPAVIPGSHKTAQGCQGQLASYENHKISSSVILVSHPAKVYVWFF